MNLRAPSAAELPLALEPEPSDTTSRRKDFARLIRWLLLLVPVVVLAVAAWNCRAMWDDGFINLRVVDEILHGHGPVFNPGQRVEAYTSPLWIWLLVVSDLLLPLRLEWIAVLGGITLSILGVMSLMAGAARLHVPSRERRANTVFLPIGALVLVALPAMWTYSSTGLENGLSFCWLGGCAWVLSGWASGTRALRRLGAVLVGLGPLVRPDLLLFTLVFLVAVVFDERRHGWRACVRLIGWALALPVAYEVFRMGYYGMLVPNTALTKSAAGSRWGEGWRYLWDVVGPYGLWFPFAVLTVVVGWIAARAWIGQRGRPTIGTLPSRRALVAGAFVVGGTLSALYTMRVGGDFMYARLLLPALIGMLAPIAVVPLERRWLPALAVLPWALVCVVTLRAGGDNSRTETILRTNPVTVNDYMFERGGPELSWYKGPGVYLADQKLDVPTPRGGTIVATWGLGLPSYALGPDTRVVDLLGLADPFTSHLAIHRRGLAGHEKYLPGPWMAARLTPAGTAVRESDFPRPPFAKLVPRIDHPDGRPFATRVATARGVLECPAVRHLFEAGDAPLTVGRFFTNMWHSPSITLLRIPPEPADAAKSLC